MTIKKAVLTLIGVLMLAVLLPLATTSAQASPATPSLDGYTSREAAVAVKCKGKSCTGKNPQTMGCEKDAKTIASKRPGGGGPKVELRYSKRCQAAWSRLQKANPSWDFKVEGKGGPIHTGYGSLEHKAYTKMVGRPKKFKACVEQYSSDAWTCTGWH